MSDPVKKIEQSVIPGMTGGYVTYKIMSATDLPGYKQSEDDEGFAVRRRFNDFVVRALQQHSTMLAHC